MAKANYQNVNPRSLANRSDRELRKMYSEFRSILRKRNERMDARGIPIVYPTPEPVKNVHVLMLRHEVAWMAAALRDPVSKLSTNVTRNIGVVRKLAGHGWTIPEDKLEDFGRFMKATHKRQGETYKGKSSVAATIYSEIIKTGVSGKTLERSFKAWLENTEKMKQLLEKAQAEYAEHPGKRVTANELKDALSGKKKKKNNRSRKRK